MKKELTYKKYKGSIEFSKEDKIYFGKVLNLNDLVSYEGKDITELEKDFEFAIEDYIKRN